MNPNRRPQRASGDETRQRLLDVGALLFAQHGIDGVELQALQHAAGTKNQSAVRYHFGGRTGLASAIIERHLHSVEARRKHLVDELARDDAADDLHRLLNALLSPMTASFGSRIGRAQLRLVAQLSEPHLAYTQQHFSLIDAPAGATLESQFQRASASLPPQVQRERLAVLRDQVIQLVGLRARLIDERDPPNPDHTDEVWQSNLIDQLAAGLATPVSRQTESLLSAPETAGQPARPTGRLRSLSTGE